MEDVRQARKLARQAKQLARRGEWGEASKLLSRAEELHPSWEYAYELARGHHANGMLPLAWRSLVRADDHGVPDRKRSRFDRFQAKVEVELLVGHAFIELVDVPENADVRINGAQWLEPYGQWVPRNFSHLSVEHPEYIKADFRWHHITGQTHRRSVRLTPRSEYGRVRVTGSPDGSAVVLDGNEIGKLPSARSDLLRPGEYPLKIEGTPEFIGHRQKVAVNAGEITDVTIVLEPTASDFEKLMVSRGFWGWTFTGTGGALTIVGAALLGVAGSRAGDLDDLNATHPQQTGSYADYSERYDDLAGGVDGMATGGHVMLWVGLAMAGAGAALLVLESKDPDGGAARLPAIDPALVRF